ncbi:hypothetical protein R1sor_003765 [Riccia sorocarpa]|uniref:Uncharacterized protein n=1 Tax=Riccia sorocarpa TaxID=122646 RepID=A0ABD3H2J9_9MARC
MQLTATKLEASSAVEGDVNPRSLLEEELHSVEYFDQAEIHHTLGDPSVLPTGMKAGPLFSVPQIIPTRRFLHRHEESREQRRSGRCGRRHQPDAAKIRKQHDEKKRLALEVAAEVKRRITERAAAKEVLVMMKREMESCVRVMEKEKLDLQDGFDKELERRENDWYAKFEKSRSEENWLRERVRRLEEEKGSMQSELEAVASKENNLREKVREFEQQMDGHRKRVEGAEKTILDLRQSLANSIQQTRQAENEVEMVKKAYLETERESQKLSEVQGSSILRKSLARAHRDGRKDTGERLVRTKSVSSADGDSSRRMTPEQAGADDVAQNSGLSVQDALVVANSSNIVGFTAALDGRYDLLERSGAA